MKSNRIRLNGNAENRPAGCFFVLLAVGLFLHGLVFRGEAAASDALQKSSEIATVAGTVEVWVTDTAGWQPAKVGQALRIGDKLRTGKQSRATIRLADLSVLRISELTLFEILPPLQKEKKPLLDLKNGSLYFFSREKPAEVQFRTPTVAGAIRGTEFVLQAMGNGETLLALLDGEVELGNEAGQITLRSGEQARAVAGQAPTKTALIDAISVIQWCLYYPAVLDSDEINFTAQERADLRESLAAYRAGDLLKALAILPADAGPPSEASLVFQAALQLSVGRVDQAEKLLQSAPPGGRLPDALREMIAAVQGRTWSRSVPPTLVSEKLAHSYYLQSLAQLEEALKVTRAATAQAASFGFAWARVAELEFSFGRARQAGEALGKALQLSPRHAQALALNGFIFAAQERVKEATVWFDKAIEADGALGNAWLGRGLCRIRLGQNEDGRKDLQVAAALEPQRALLRSYLGKAFNQTGQDVLAEKEIRLAKKLDPKDPTGWLYSALLNQQRNRVNEAIHDLERSQELNENQKVFRSKLLLDQDAAVRGANLAIIYQDAGLTDVSLREAAKAVNSDYANYSAHLFLANSYDALRDPKLYNLRYETAARSEWLLGNLLAPVSASTLSRNLSQQEYARLFEQNRLGLNSQTEYFSNGEWVETASQYGNYGKVGYSLDAYYRSDPGLRPNNDLEHRQFSAQIKAQLTPQDSLFFWAEYFGQETGDVIQYYSQTNYNPTLRIKENQEPNLYLGLHHEWNPGSHTLLLLSRLDDTLNQSEANLFIPFFKFERGARRGVTYIGQYQFDKAFERAYQAYSVELQQVLQMHPHTFIAGGRYQTGWADTFSQVTQVDAGPRPPIGVANTTEMERITFYGYYQLQLFEPLRLTAGASYDRLHYPENVDTSPISNLETTRDRISPKVGLVYTPWKGSALRGMYSHSLGAFLQENNVELEPTEIAGFNQLFRSIIPESAGGLISGARFEAGGFAFEERLPTGTYLGVEGQWLSCDANRWVGTVTGTTPMFPDKSYISERQVLDFKEKSLLVTVNQLILNEWSLGARYRLSEADLHSQYPDVPLENQVLHTTITNVSALQSQAVSGTLHQLDLFAAYNHRCGFYAQFHSVWSAQSNHGYTPSQPGDDFWQHNFFLGYRFPHRHAEVRLGVLNLTGQDYQLNPLNLYAELPRGRMFTVMGKFNF